MVVRRVPKESGIPNLFCWSDLRTKCDGKFDNDRNVFTAVIGGIQFEFQQRGKIYAGDLSALLALRKAETTLSFPFDTVEQRRTAYTKAEVSAATAAYDLVSKMAGVSEKDVIDMLNHGDISNCDVTKADILRSKAIEGNHLQRVRGGTKRMKQHRVRRLAPLDIDVERKVSVYADIAFVDGMPLMISTAGSVRILQGDWLKGRNYASVKKAVLKQLNKLERVGFEVTELHSDGEGAIKKMESDLPVDVRFNARSKNQHVSEIEPKIRHVKERVRGIYWTLPYRLSKIMLMWCVLYVITRLNWVPTSVTSERISANNVLLGRKLNAETDLDLKHGDYVEAHSEDTITNTVTVSRTEPCIALMPDGNVQGTWWFMQLRNFEPVRRDRYTKLPMTQAVIDVMNKWADETRGGMQEPIFMYDGQEVEVSQQQSEQLPEPDLLDADLLESQNIQLVDEYREDVGQESDLGVRNELSSGVRDEFGSGVRSGSDLGVHEGPVDTAQLASEPMNERPLDTSILDVPQQEPRQSRREGLRPREHGNIGDKPMRWEERRKLKLESAESQYGLRISVTKAIKSLGKAAVKSIVKELVGIHNEKAWEPVRMRDLSYKQKSKIVRSFLFLKEKYTSTGEFEKLKARLVAGGQVGVHRGRDFVTYCESVSAVHRCCGSGEGKT
jgi:hypothetical protein